MADTLEELNKEYRKMRDAHKHQLKKKIAFIFRKYSKLWICFDPQCQDRQNLNNLLQRLINKEHESIKIIPYMTKFDSFKVDELHNLIADCIRCGFIDVLEYATNEAERLLWKLN